MPTIPGETARGTRLLPAVTAGQALGLLATAAVGRLAWSGHGALELRALRALPVVAAGVAYTFGHWPPGPGGERLASWLPRVVRYCLRPRLRSGAGVVGWEGLREVHPEGLWHERGGAIVLECTGSGQGLEDPDVLRAAQVAYRELLHSLEAPLQIVGSARWIREADRPPLWDPSRAPAGLAPIAEAYAAHWRRLVEDRGAMVRRSLLVLSVPSARDPNHAGTVGVPEAAAVRFAHRLGLAVRRLRGDELARVVLEAAGAAEPGGAIARGDGYRVGAARD